MSLPIQRVDDFVEAHEITDEGQILAIPCLIVVRLAKVLAAPEISLLGLLEVIFGVLLAWVGAGEVPSADALAGGALVLVALLGNEWWALRQRQMA